MRRAAVALLLATALAGCGGKMKPNDPGRDVLGGFLEAAARHNAAAMRDYLSPQSGGRFKDAELEALSLRLDSFSRAHRFVVSERITDRFGVAVIAAGADVYGTALRKTGNDWGLELKGPVQITPLGPRPGAREAGVGQVAAELHHAPGTGVALLYLDGGTLPDTRVYRQGGEATIFANLAATASAGRHTVTAFATSGSNASARSWSFVARG